MHAVRPWGPLSPGHRSVLVVLGPVVLVSLSEPLHAAFPRLDLIPQILEAAISKGMNGDTNRYIILIGKVSTYLTNIVMF